MNQTDLKQKYSKEHFLALNSQLIDANYSTKTLAISTANSKLIETAEYLGEYQSLDLHIITIKHTSSNDARVGVSMEIFKLMKDYALPNALVAAYSAESDSWRYSLITSSLSINSTGKITKAFSNPRRYSFVLGPNQKVLTPFKQLIQLGKVVDLPELSKRFSLEVVNNEFYKAIASLYDELVGTDKIPRKLKYPTTGNNSHEFAARLIGRIIFCWFLREKKSKAGIPLIPTSILSSEAASQKDYYHAVLAPLFFEVLNKPINQNKRSKKYEVGEYKLIPYLNGGLFNDDDIDKYKYDSELELTISSPIYADVPDTWLRDFFDLLERYNFTVDENTSYDTDLSIDPEMLGRVFENLLARINPETGATVRKSTGSFYTPREIVEYMVDCSLTEYLITKTNVSKAKLDALISYDIFDDIGNELSIEENVSVLEALSTLTVLDPACGSGAYPIGVLQKIVFIITRLDPQAKWWLEKQLAGASPELKKEFENRSIDYVRKLGIIRQTIFGVDIQPIATEISRLRCFLTLIVDEEIDDSRDNRGIRPLPNLDFKFVTANTLIGLSQKNGDQIQLVDRAEDIEGLATIMAEYFTANTTERDGIKYKFTLAQKKLYEKLRVTGELAENTHTLKLTSWNPFENILSEWFEPKWMFGIEKGFDIVIGNPPYVNIWKIEKGIKKTYEALYKSAKGHYDLYVLFYEKGLNLLNKEGILAYITSNKWMAQSYGKGIREIFLKLKILSLLDFSAYQVFDSATVDTQISFIKNIVQDEDYDILVYYNNVKSVPTMSEIKYTTINTEFFRLNDEINFKINLTSTKINLLNKIKIHSIKVDDILYTTKGAELHSTKNKIKKEVYIKDEYSSGLKNYIEGKYFDRYSINKIKYLSYEPQKHKAPVFPELFESEKIIVKNVVGRLGIQAIIDDQNLYNNDAIINGVPYFVLKDLKYSQLKSVFTPIKLSNSKKYSLKYILAVLNSKVTSWYFKELFSNGLHFYPRHLREMRIPRFSDTKFFVANIEKSVDQILTLKKQNKDADTKNLESQIDQLVYKLYELTPEEIAIIEGSTK
jgi:hypothetical protein